MEFLSPTQQKCFRLPFAPDDVLKGHIHKKDETVLCWSDKLVNDFNLAKKTFSEFTLLNFPQDNVELLLTCDASSNVACGAVLEQAVVVNGKTEYQLLGFYSTKFESPQLKCSWSTYDEELYAFSILL